MVKKPRVIVLRTAGTNCNLETSFSFAQSGADVDEVHLEKLFAKKVSLADYHIMALPGGFSYGDDIASGKIFANELRLRLGDELKRFIDAKKLILGICNGFQILVKAGILPGVFETGSLKQTATLTQNDSGKFESRWVHLKVSGHSVWTQGLKDIIYIPVAHGEGKFIPKNDQHLKALQKNGQIAFRYVLSDGQPAIYPHNPSGSIDGIAGITDITGRVMGLMPHPERYVLATQHPFWTRFDSASRQIKGDGAQIFQNGINYVKENLL